VGIDQVHEIVLFCLSAERMGEKTHAEIDIALNRASKAHFNELYNNPKRWRMDKQLGEIYYGGSQRINDALSPFKKTQAYSTGDTPSGVLTLNADFLHLVSIVATVFNATLARNTRHQIAVVNEEEIADAFESQVSPVGLTNPFAIMNADKQVQLFPEQTQSGKVYYFKAPVDCEYAYTQVGRVVSFDEPNSTDLEWNEIETYNVITMALKDLGVNLSSADVINYATAKQAQGE